MEPTPDNKPAAKDDLTDNSTPLDTTLVPAEIPSDEARKLWDAYREQQRRRSCPGCGDDGSLF